jgi:hypothetical protein
MIHKSLQVIREDELIAVHSYTLPDSPGGRIVNSDQMQRMPVTCMSKSLTIALLLTKLFPFANPYLSRGSRSCCDR